MIDLIVSAGIGLAVSIFFVFVVVMGLPEFWRSGPPRNRRRPVIFRSPRAQHLEGVLFRLYLESRKN